MVKRVLEELFNNISGIENMVGFIFTFFILISLWPHCDLLGINMPAGWLIKHQRTELCDNNTQIRWRRRDVAIADRFSEATFSLTG